MISIILITLIPTMYLYAGGDLLPERANPAIGTANVGQAAFANDASTAFFNPAGMTQLSETQALIGLQALLGNIHFKPNQQNNFSGPDGGQAVIITPGSGIYTVLDWSPV